jgi:hypothetical protein
MKMVLIAAVVQSPCEQQAKRSPVVPHVACRSQAGLPFAGTSPRPAALNLIKSQVALFTDVFFVFFFLLCFK